MVLEVEKNVEFMRSFVIVELFLL